MHIVHLHVLLAAYLALVDGDVVQRQQPLKGMFERAAAALRRRRAQTHGAGFALVLLEPKTTSSHHCNGHGVIIPLSKAEYRLVQCNIIIIHQNSKQ